MSPARFRCATKLIQKLIQIYFYITKLLQNHPCAGIFSHSLNLTSTFLHLNLLMQQMQLYIPCRGRENTIAATLVSGFRTDRSLIKTLDCCEELLCFASV